MDDSPSAAPSTSAPAPGLDRDLLMAQYDWVRSVANHLVRDRTRAEDVTQETVLAALKAPPRDAADAARLRAWLGRVAFNLSKLGARQGMRRRAREERVARGEATPSVSDEVESLATMQALADAVAGLPDPYREAVELRYFEGLSTAEIGRRAGTSDLAVRKRLWRARGKLRDALEGPEERRSVPAWLAPVFTLWRPLRGLRVPSLTSLSATAATTLLGLAGIAWWCRGESALPERVAARPDRIIGAREQADIRGEAPTRSEPADGQRRAIAPPPSGSSPEPRTPPPDRVPPLPPEVPTRGRVLDLQGNARAGLDLFAGPDSLAALGRSDLLGDFALERDGLPMTVEARGLGWTTVAPGRVRAGSEERELLVVVAESAPLSGWVVDSEGRPIEGADLEVHCTEWAFADLALAGIERVPTLDSPRLRTARSAADGAFSWSDLPRGAGLFLRARAPGFLAREVPTEELSASIRLELALETDFLTGVVLGSDGAPAVGARVRLGLGTAFSDHRGRFRLPLRGVEADSILQASQPGVKSACESGFGQHVLAGMRHGVVVTLGEAEVWVEGAVKDVEGRRQSGYRVLAYSIESAQAGSEGPEGEGLTDAEGRFRLRLTPGRYAVVALGADHGAVVESAIDTRSAPWSLSVDPTAMREQIGGVRFEGQAVRGARVEVALLVEAEGGPRRIDWGSLQSEVDGTWAFQGPPHLAFEVRVDTPEVEGPRTFRGRPWGGRMDLELTRDAMLLVQAPDSGVLRLLNEDGQALWARGPLGARAEFQLHEGRAPLLEVPSDTRWLALSGSGGERLVPLALTPGRVTEVRAD